MSKREFIDWLKSKGLSPRTIKEYTAYFERLDRVGGFTQSNVDLFCRHIKNNVGRSFLKNYKEFLIRNPENQHLRIIDIPKFRHKKRQTPNVITEKEVREIEKYMRSEGSKLILLLSFYCALRISELFSITIRDFNWDEWYQDTEKNGMLRIKGKGNKYEKIPVKSELMNRTLKWLREGYEQIQKEQPIFPIHPDTWRKLLRKTSERAIGRQINPHLLRHSFAVHLVKKGWDINHIKEFLRHEDIGTTQIYAKVPKEKIIEMYSKL